MPVFFITIAKLHKINDIENKKPFSFCQNFVGLVFLCKFANHFTIATVLLINYNYDKIRAIHGNGSQIRRP